MGALSKALKILGIVIGVIVLFIVILLVAAFFYAVSPPHFTVKSVEIVDYDGYPAIEISFTTNKYPVDFYLMSPNGSEIYEYTATQPETADYLYLTPGEPYHNIVGEHEYVIDAYYSGNRIWSYDLTIQVLSL